MSLSKEANDALDGFYSVMANNYKVKVGDIVAGFAPGAQKIPKFLHSGFELICSNEDHPLTDINVVMVEDRQGEAFLWADGEPCTSRTNMNNADREPKSLLGKPSKYNTSETQCDIHIPYGILSKWAIASKSKQYSKEVNRSFINKYCALTQKRVCLDVLNIGFNGISSEEDTTPSPKLINVNKGWTQIVKEQKPEQIFDDELSIGYLEGGKADYVNLDAAVADLIDTAIDISFRDDLVCIISDNLIADERWRFYNSINFHTEKKLTSDTFEHFGGLDRVSIPNFPDNTIVITSLDNLSVYIKESTTYRQIQTNAKRNRVEDYQHREEAYVVENMSKYAAFTSLKPIRSPEDKDV